MFKSLMQIAVVGMIVVGCKMAAGPTETPPPTPTSLSTPTSTPVSPSSTPTANPTATATARAAEPTSPTHAPSPTPSTLVVFSRNQILYQSPSLTIYSKGSRACALGADGQPRFLAPAGFSSYQPSSDEQLVLLIGVRQASDSSAQVSYGTLSVVNSDGSNLRQLVDLAGYQHNLDGLNGPGRNYDYVFSNATWIPGTHKIAFSTAVRYAIPFGSGTLPQYLNDLYSVDADSGDITALLPQGSGGEKLLPSPDGQTIALITRGQSEAIDDPPFIKVTGQDSISLVSLGENAAKRTVLTYDGVITPLNEGFLYYDPTMAWRPDSSGLVVVGYTTNPQSVSPPPTITGWFIPTGGTAQTLFTLQALDFSMVDHYSLLMSPNGAYLGFRGSSQGRDGIHIIDMQTMADTVFDTGGYLVRWEPDSQHFRVGKYPPGSFGPDAQAMRGTVGGQLEAVGDTDSSDALSACAP